ncbi:cobalamin synthase [Halarchaeum rubridurum]|uniref:Cobalamin synthase n=1 Tax=Halarchaeum rubridurum TaxID=489911 RepID=A0A830FRC2_9EURY|nr:hypothetical protein [Halarchaeum rubridurum]MBP1953606.1 cobalamin synthase [Halarchaeum rubridurum]GGM63978.1 hypothetical protein GCM10009017_12570 [Halarchaeum rubridurum]
MSRHERSTRSFSINVGAGGIVIAAIVLLLYVMANPSFRDNVPIALAPFAFGAACGVAAYLACEIVRR